MAPCPRVFPQLAREPPARSSPFRAQELMFRGACVGREREPQSAVHSCQGKVVVEKAFEVPQAAPLNTGISSL